MVKSQESNNTPPTPPTPHSPPNMHNLNLKSLAFYGVAIGLVLVLFNVVTVYGETHLKAPPQIASNYSLVFAENLPVCEKSEPLFLNIQQSGVYLNASLSPNNNSATTKKKSSLTGKLNNQQLTLSGQAPKSILCNVAGQTQKVTIQMQLAKKSDLTGQISIDGFPKPVGFIATAEKVKKNQKSNH